MPEQIRVEFLGTGTSDGVPVVGCGCAVCKSENPKNRRYRPAILVEWQGKRLLVDTPPELRLQLLRAGVGDLDALLYTHTHADHLFGLDDVRAITRRQGRPLPVYGSALTLERLQQQYDYIFVGPPVGGGKPSVDLHEIAPLDKVFRAADRPVQPIPVLHGHLPILGYRFGGVAYLTDTSAIPESSFPLLKNLDVLILDALRERPHPTHFSLDEALAAVRRIAPRRAYFTHICHDLDHDRTNERLPPSVQLAYDGLVVEAPSTGG